MQLPITDDMRDSHNIFEMCEAFHPTAMWGTFGADETPVRNAHPSRVIDAIEAALLYGAQRISRVEFMQAVEDIGEWDEEVP